MAIIKPHLAETADLELIKFPSVVFCKIDGVRGINLGSLTSRLLRPFKNSRLEADFSNPLLRGFDGELAVGSLTDGKTCRRTTSCVNSYKSPDSPDWYVFDYLWNGFEARDYKDRYNKLALLVSALPPDLAARVKPVPMVQIVNSLDELMQFHQKSLDAGYEGTVIRYLHGKHKSGRCTEREANFLRIKEWQTAEGVIIGFEEAQENFNPAKKNALGRTERSSHKENLRGKGMVGNFQLQLPDGQVITVGAGCLSHEERLEYFVAPELILGKVATYKFMPYGEKDKPRFAQIAKREFVSTREDIVL